MRFSSDDWTAGDRRPDVPWVNARRHSVGEGMIPAESRMQRIRTSGSTSRGVETDPILLSSIQPSG